MAATNNSLLTALECKMLEWMNVDIDHAEVAYKDQAEQFEALFKESEQKAILQEDIKYWGVDEYSEIIELDKEIIQKLCA